jgi:hypothetical protein
MFYQSGWMSLLSQGDEVFLAVYIQFGECVVMS